MGKEQKDNLKLFYPSVNLEKRVRPDHILRKINKNIDFNFVYDEVKDKYGQRGNVSVPPPIILKMLLLLILFNVRSERELMITIPERLDWLWFLGYDLDSEIPHHSVLSKAKRRWGEKVFKSFFKRIVVQCVSKGLVNGKKIFMDSSLVQANASNNSIIKRDVLDRKYKELAKRMDKTDNDKDGKGTTNAKYISTTDPDATIVKKGAGSQRLHYQVHRGVDEKTEVITATEVTTGSVNEASRLSHLSNQHQSNTGKRLKTIVADKKYGIIENYLYYHDNKINSHFNTMDAGRYKQQGIFDKKLFKYKKRKNLYICPAGEKMIKRVYHKNQNAYEYKTDKKICGVCNLKLECTRSKTGRSIKRHVRLEDLDKMYKKAGNSRSQLDIKKRQHLMERSFAYATRFGCKKARWRSMEKMNIQEYLTSSIQNIKKLVAYLDKKVLNFLIYIKLQMNIEENSIYVRI